MAGWSHTVGGTAKSVANSMDDWPTNLAHMRSLCKNCRNPTYRKHIARRLKNNGPDNLKELMKSFSATFAKWRYESVFTVLSQLNPLRNLCENFLDFALFSRPQDKEEYRLWMVACRSKQFWKWAAVALPEVFQELEEIRRFGMVCDCPEHVAERQCTHGKVFVRCWRMEILLHYYVCKNQGVCNLINDSIFFDFEISMTLSNRTSHHQLLGTDVG